MKNIDSYTHTRGESIYVDDIPVTAGTLFGCVFGSPKAHGRIKSLDLSAALAMPEVHRILTYKDVPGENQIGGIFPDEPLMADGEVHFQGQPVAFVMADSDEAAHEACRRIKIEIEELPVITDPRKAAAVGKLIHPPRTFELGAVDATWEKCVHVFEGIAETGGQEHLYIEGQGAYAWPEENNCVKIASSTQGPTAVQKTAAKVLGIPMHKIEVDVRRLGGGFGGKEDQATPWAVFAGLGAFLTQKPVKYILHRMDDMKMTGKRHPYSSDYKIGLDKDLNILAYEATFYQDSGAASDLSPAVLERTLFHATNTYFVPNVKATAYPCKTNLPPNTAFRGFGGPQGMFVIESAMGHAADELGVDRMEIQRKNLLKEGDEFPYGQKTELCQAISCWDDAVDRFDLPKLRAEIDAFNASNNRYKKGLALMPICFGISFTNTSMNQARALVHVYSDGSVGISTGAVEMGQGVNTKMLQVAAHVLSISPDRVKLETTNTTRIANTSPSAASATADLNGRALQTACVSILNRMKQVAADHFETSTDQIELKEEWVYAKGAKTDWDWPKLVMTTHLARVNLSEHSHYSTPDIHFDKTKEKGHPFAYHVFGTAITTVTVDCLRGRYEVDSVKCVHDFGKSMNEIIDMGQMDGGIVQGIGWMTMEELIYNEEGRLLSNALSTYKVPDIYSVPKELTVHFHDAPGSPLAIFRSKAVGEPPLMYGIGAWFAIREAVKAFNPQASIDWKAPYTPEKVLMDLWTKDKASVPKA